MVEEWRDIKGYEGKYRINNLGRVLSLERKGSNGCVIHQKYLQCKRNKKGYLSFGLYKEGKQMGRRVSRLVAQTFILNPENKPEVNHIDGNKENNRADNLEWCTRKENMFHARNVLKVIRRGEDSPRALLKDIDVTQIRKYLKDSKCTMKKIAEMYNVSSKVISRISLGQSWEHLLNSTDKVGVHRFAKGENNGAAKLTEDNVREIRKLLASSNFTQREIAAGFKVNRAIIGRIKNGAAWKHVK